jgi:hypothetical protein
VDGQRHGNGRRPEIAGDLSFSPKLTVKSAFGELTFAGPLPCQNLRNFGRLPVFNFMMNNEPQDIQRQMRELLSRLPDAPIASNFTARVLQAVELEEMRRSRWRLFDWHWRAFFPRAAAASVVAALAVFTAHQHELYVRQVALAKSAAFMVNSQPMPSVDALKNFAAIQRMSQPAHPDDELLALASDMK